VEGGGPLQEDHKAMLDVHKTALCRVLKAPMQDRKKGTGRKATILPNTLKQVERLLNIYHCWTAKQMKDRVPALSGVSDRFRDFARTS
jgi:hypothetical protein